MPDDRAHPQHHTTKFDARRIEARSIAGSLDPRAASHWATVLGPDLLIPGVFADRPATEAEAGGSRPECARGAPEASAQQPTAAAPLLPDDSGSPTERLTTLAAAAEACRRCRLGSTRTQAVFSDGDPTARIVFCGEGPGADEDRIGRPFVGRAGELLTRIIEGAMGMPRESVYIANIVKCRPPQNRNPEPDEQAACLPFLRAQLDIVQPDLIIALGKIAAHALLRVDPKTPMGRLRGRVHEIDGLRILPTWHPAYLLRNPAAKSQTWDDIKVALRFLGLPERPEPYRRG